MTYLSSEHRKEYLSISLEVNLAYNLAHPPIVKYSKPLLQEPTLITQIYFQTRNCLKPNKYHTKKKKRLIKINITKNKSIVDKEEMRYYQIIASRLPIMKPNLEPSLTTLSNILPTVSMTITNNKGDNKSPCLNPLELPKISQGELLIKMEKQAVDKQKKIHYLHFSVKPHYSNIRMRKF